MINMKTLSVCLVILMICVACEAGPLRRIFQKLENLEAKVDALIQKNAVTGNSSDPWFKLNSNPVCFGAKNSQYGSFHALEGGDLMKLKLVHLYGYVSCWVPYDYYWSHWGCGYYSIGGNIDYTGVSLTDQSNTILFPPSNIDRSDKWALIPGYSSRSPELVMSIFDSPVTVSKGHEYRLWYTQDLENGPESDNGGRVCADVFGQKMP